MTEKKKLRKPLSTSTNNKKLIQISLSKTNEVLNIRNVKFYFRRQIIAKHFFTRRQLFSPRKQRNKIPLHLTT